MDFSICDNMVGFPKYSHILRSHFNEHMHVATYVYAP